MPLPSVYEFATDSRQTDAFMHARAIMETCLTSGGQKKVALIIGNGVNSQLEPGTDLIEAIKRKGKGKRPPLGPLYGYEYIRRDKWLKRWEKEAGGEALSAAEGRLLPWRYHERLRLESTRMMPRPAIAYAFYLILRGLVSCVITPSYDLFIESMLRKTGVPYTLQPGDLRIAGVRKVMANRRRSEPRRVELCKYHGSVEYVRFEECGCILKLPEFSVYPLHELRAGLEEVFKAFDKGQPDRDYQWHYHYGHLHPSGWPDHFIDFNYPDLPRHDLFAMEIDAATESIESMNKADTAGILILGFAGRAGANKNLMSEEIVSSILDRVRCGIPASMIFLPSPIDFQRSALAQGLLKMDDRQIWIANVSEAIYRIMDAFRDLRPGLGLPDAWRLGGLFEVESEGGRGPDAG